MGWSPPWLGPPGAGPGAACVPLSRHGGRDTAAGARAPVRAKRAAHMQIGYRYGANFTRNASCWPLNIATEMACITCRGALTV